MKFQYRAEVKQSGLHIYHRKDFDKDVQQFLGKKVTITIEQAKRKRSNPQNAYIHAVLIPMCKDGLFDVGYKYSISETKDELKKMFAIFDKVNEQTGEIREYIKGTSDMTTSEMMGFIADVQQWAAEFLNIYIPDPGEQTKIEI